MCLCTTVTVTFKWPMIYLLNMAIVHTCVSLPEGIFERTCPVRPVLGRQLVSCRNPAGLGRDGIQLETDSTVTRQKALAIPSVV